MGSGAAAARGGGLRSRAGRAGVRLLPDPGHGAACRRLGQALRRALDAVGPEWGARVGAASRRFAALAAATVAPAGRALVIDDGETHLFLEPLPARRPSALAGAEGGAFGARRQAPGGAGTPPRDRGRRSARCGRRGSMAARSGGGRHLRRAAPSAGRAGGDADVSGTGCERAHARAGTRGAHRASARPPGAGRPGSQAARHLGEARRGRLLAELAHAARADGGARPPSARASTQAVGAAGSDGGAPPRAGRAHRVGRDADRARSVPVGAACASACAVGCARCARRWGWTLSAPSWRWRHGPASPESRAILVPRDD